MSYCLALVSSFLSSGPGFSVGLGTHCICEDGLEHLTSHLGLHIAVIAGIVLPAWLTGSLVLARELRERKLCVLVVFFFFKGHIDAYLLS